MEICGIKDGINMENEIKQMSNNEQTTKRSPYL